MGFGSLLVGGLLVGGCMPQGTKPDPEPTPPPVEPQPPVPCPTLLPQELEREALELLDAGNAVAAREKLDCVLELKPNSYKATTLLEQLDADPVAYLGRKHFIYTVQSSETLSKIADRFLGSSLKFVILARYNDIDVPANLLAGQRIKVPGAKPTQPIAAPQTEPKMAVPAPESEPAAPATNPAEELREQALAREKQGDLDQAYTLMSEALKKDPALDRAQSDLNRIKQAVVRQLEEAAYDLELSGGTEKAIGTWQKILKIDPGNIPAQLALKRLAQ